MDDTFQHHWDPDYTRLSPLFNPLIAVTAALSKNHPDRWPGLIEYQQLLKNHTDNIHSQHGLPIRFVEQGERPSSFNQHYEPRIYLQGEVQTRTENWHDFFQVLIWSQFPRIKIQLNALHYQAALQRQTATPRQHNRSPLENALTLFDECGIIITSSDPTLLDLIREFQWKELFWHRRDELEQGLQCIVFGHALYEKALQPYVGMTGNALLIDVDRSFHDLNPQQQATQLDKKISRCMQHKANDIEPTLLTPFPLLGMPGWDTDNHSDSYYDNKSYFRDKRRPRT